MRGIPVHEQIIASLDHDVYLNDLVVSNKSSDHPYRRNSRPHRLNNRYCVSASSLQQPVFPCEFYVQYVDGNFRLRKF